MKLFFYSNLVFFSKEINFFSKGNSKEDKKVRLNLFGWGYCALALLSLFHPLLFASFQPIVFQPGVLKGQVNVAAPLNSNFGFFKGN
jgi:hypothetical protein